MSAQQFIRRRQRCAWLALLVFEAVTVVPAAAQTGQGPDLIDKLKALNEIQAQKMEVEVREALADYQKLVGSHPQLALERLQKTLTLLEADRALTPGRRDLLSRQLRERIRIAQTEANRATQQTASTNDRLIRADQKGREAEARAVEQEIIQRTLSHISDLQKQGRITEATRMAEDLFRRYPHLAAPQVIGQTTSILGQVAYLNQLREEQAERRNAGLNNVDRSALMPGSDMEFPKDWATRIAKREPANLPGPSAKEKAILSALDKEVSVNFKDKPFLEAIEDISTALGQPILLDKNALADALVDSETLVNLTVKNIKARTVLRKVLGDVGLAYVIKDDAIQVLSEKQARETMITKTYYLGTLLAGGPFTNAGIRFFPGATQFEAMQNVLSIVQLIQNTIDPQSWQVNGGQGTISFHGPSMSLIIRNTAEVHGMMSSMLR